MTPFWETSRAAPSRSNTWHRKLLTTGRDAKSYSTSWNKPVHVLTALPLLEWNWPQDLRHTSPLTSDRLRGYRDGYQEKYWLWILVIYHPSESVSTNISALSSTLTFHVASCPIQVSYFKVSHTTSFKYQCQFGNPQLLSVIQISWFHTADQVINLHHPHVIFQSVTWIYDLVNGPLQHHFTHVSISII
jgi:hypothetical protein